MSLQQIHFYFTEDYVLAYECMDCEHYEDWDDDYNEPESCSKCGSEHIVNDTAHEGLECDLCNHVFEPWEDMYTDDSSKQSNVEKICTECFEGLDN